MTSHNESGATARPPRLPGALILLAVVCVLLFASLAVAITSAPTVMQAKLVPVDGAQGYGFGDAVSIDGDTAVVGSPRDDVKGTNSGSAYVYVRNGTMWTQQAKLVPTDGAELDVFGVSVSVSGDTAVIGSFWDDDMGTNSGSAYVYVRNGTTWTQQAKLVPADGAAYDHFGLSVSISGDTVVVGSVGDDDLALPYSDSFLLGLDHGSAYVFARTSTQWTQQAKLVVDDADGMRFGASVSVSGDTAIIGSPGDVRALFLSLDAGAAYVFTRTGNTWTQQAKLAADDGAAGDWFGSSVSISGNTVIIGSDFDEGEGVEGGSAYVFTRTDGGWAQEAKIVPDDGAQNALFGSSVSVSGEIAIVGSPWDDDDRGRAYVFKRTAGTWTQQANLRAADRADGDRFGDSVSVSGETAIVGADADDDQGVDSGSAYVYAADPDLDNGVLSAGGNCAVSSDSDAADADGMGEDCDPEENGGAQAGEPDQEVPGVGVVPMVVLILSVAYGRKRIS